MLHLGIIWCWTIFHMSAGDDRPVCVVKRFRKSTSVSDSVFSAPAILTSQPAASPLVRRPDTGTPDTVDGDSWSVISPVDLFGAGVDAESVDLSQFDLSQPRWNELGDYNFGYQPGNPLDASPAARRPPFGQSNSAPWVPPQLHPRQFHHPGFGPASVWRPPVPVLKSKVQLGARPALGAHVQSKQLMPHVSTLRRICPDAPVVRDRPTPVANLGSGSSMQQAWDAAKAALALQWKDILESMGSCSGLVASLGDSRNSADHVTRVIAKFAPSTLQAYFRIWNRWMDFSTNLQTDPYCPDVGLLADFLAEHAHGPLQVATASFKGLAWMARNAQLSALQEALHSPICKCYLQTSTISEKRESAPLPLSFVLFVERLILNKSTPPGDILQLGAILLMIWSSLRWSDALWINPASLSIQQHAMFALSSHTKTTNRGMPIACFAFGLTGQHGSSAWAQVWLNVVQQALHDTKGLYPKFAVDFLLTEIGEDVHKPLFLQPMQRDRGLQLIRYWLCKCHAAHSVEARPEDFHLLGTHSCKTTMLSWAQQLQLPLEQRQLQGHHRSAINGSVSLYSRSDTFPALLLQVTIAQKIAEGFRPLRPMLRGGAPSLPDFAVQVPAWRPLLGVDELPISAADPPQIEPVQDDLDETGSVASEESIPPEAPAASDLGPVDEIAFLFNPISKVAHVACKCDRDDRAFCYAAADSQHWRTCCGARPNAVSGDLAFTMELPVGARLCLRHACAKVIAHVE